MQSIQIQTHWVLSSKDRPFFQWELEMDFWFGMLISVNGIVSYFAFVSTSILNKRLEQIPSYSLTVQSGQIATGCQYHQESPGKNIHVTGGVISTITEKNTALQTVFPSNKTIIKKNMYLYSYV